MKKLSMTLLSVAVGATFGLSQLGFSQQGYTQRMNTFKGTTLHQSGMSLEDASTFASVTAEQALTLVQEKVGNLPEGASAELTLLNGYLVWTVDLGTEVISVDITNPELVIQQQAASKQYTAGEDDDDYESEHESEDDDSNQSEHESKYENDDSDDYNSESDAEYGEVEHSGDLEMGADPECDSEMDTDNETHEDKDTDAEHETDVEELCDDSA